MRKLSPLGPVRRVGRAKQLLLSIANTPLLPNHVRVRALRWAGATIGHSTTIFRGIELTGTDLEIGNSVFVNTNVTFNNSAPISIGDYVAIGPGVLFTTTEHDGQDANWRARETLAAPIIVGAGSWIGARAVILAGVSIGRGSIVAAGSVVIRDVPPDTLVGGVPARFLRALENPGPES